ncbi:MAG: tetratricopeptide repeat protein [Bacteroidota bacterium]
MKKSCLFVLFSLLFVLPNIIFGNGQIDSEHLEKIREIEQILPENVKEHTRVLLNSTDVKKQLDACGMLTNLLVNQDHETRLYFISLMEELAEKNNFDKPVAYSKISRAIIWLEQSNIHAADSLLRLAGEMAVQINYPMVLAESYSIRAYCAYAQADYPKAIELAKKAVEVNQTNLDIPEIERETGIAGAITQIASCYLEMGNFDEAVANFTGALRIVEKYNTIHSQITILHNLANCYLRQNNYSEAIKYSHKCLSMAKGQPFNNNKASAYNILGGIYSQESQLDSALFYFSKSIDAYRELEMPDHLATAYTNLGAVYLKSANPDKCIEYSEKAYAIVKNQNSLPVTLPIYLNFGNAYAELNSFKKSLNYLNKTLSLSDESGSLDYKNKALKGLSNLYFKMGDLGRAYDYHLKFYEIDKEIFGLEKEKEIQQVRIKYETDKTEAELEKEKALTDLQSAKLTQNSIGLAAAIIVAGLLTLLYFQLKKKNGVLKEARQTEALLRKESEHRIKNHLQMVAAFFRLHSQDVKEEAAKQLVKEGKNRIEAVGLLYQQLQINKGHHNMIKVKEYVDELTANLLLSLDPRSSMDYSSHIDDMELDPDQAVKLGLIINELVSNSLKHFPLDTEKPKLELSLKKDREIKLRIQDNGPGLPRDFNTRKDRSFGIRLVELMSKQLNGEFSFYNNPGACFELNFK